MPIDTNTDDRNLTFWAYWEKYKLDMANGNNWKCNGHWGYTHSATVHAVIRKHVQKPWAHSTNITGIIVLSPVI